MQVTKLRKFVSNQGNTYGRIQLNKKMLEAFLSSNGYSEFDVVDIVIKFDALKKCLTIEIIKPDEI